MAFYDWNEKLSVNVSEIDVQHKKLVGMINALFDAMKDGKGMDAMGGVLADLITYTKTHFADEEALMKKYNYPDFVSHKAIHDNLTKQVMDLQTQFKEGKVVVSSQVLNFLKDWLNNHILMLDKKFGEYINRNN